MRCAPASPAAPVSIGLEETAAGLDALIGEWNELWRRSPAATPFQTPAWLIPWWYHFRPGRLAVVTLRLDGRLVGLLPLYRDRFACLRLLGAGNSDYLDAVVDPAIAADFGPVLAGALDELVADDVELRLERLPSGSPLLGNDLVRATEGALETEDALEREEPCPVLPLPHAPGPVWKQLRYERRRLSRMGGFDVTLADSASLPAGLAGLAELHAARWADRGRPGVFADPSNAEFLRDVAAGLLAAGLLRLYLLHLGGRIVAAHFGILAKGRAYYYIGGFDPELARLSVGTVLVGHGIEEAEREGAREFDFLRGGETYKYRWGAEDRWTSRRVLRPRSSRDSTCD